jgi:hypothetical protein
VARENKVECIAEPPLGPSTNSKRQKKKSGAAPAPAVSTEHSRRYRKPPPFTRTRPGPVRVPTSATPLRCSPPQNLFHHHGTTRHILQEKKSPNFPLSFKSSRTPWKSRVLAPTSSSCSCCSPRSIDRRQTRGNCSNHRNYYSAVSFFCCWLIGCCSALHAAS